MRLMELETLGFGMQSACSPDNDDVLTKLIETLDSFDRKMECPNWNWKNEMRELHSEILHVRSSYRECVLSWIGKNMSKYQQLCDRLFFETLESLELFPIFFFDKDDPFDILSFSKDMSKSARTIYTFVACYNTASSFRACFYRKSFSAEQLKTCIEKLWALNFKSGKSFSAEQLKTCIEKLWALILNPYTSLNMQDRDNSVSRIVHFMESVAHSPEYATLLKMRDEYEIPNDLLADIEVVLSKVWEFLIKCSTSSDRLHCYTDELTISARFISIVIYTQAIISEEAAAPFQDQKGSSSLSWIDKIGVKFYEIIIESMEQILKQCSKAKNDVLDMQLRFIRYFLAGPPVGFTREGNWNDFSDTIKVTICRQVTSLFLSCYYGNKYDNVHKQSKKVLEDTIRLIYSFQRETLSHCPWTDDDLETLHNLLGKMKNLISHHMVSSHQNVKKWCLETPLEELTSLIDSINKISNERIEYEELNSLCSQTENVLCAMYFIAYPLLDGICPNSYLELWFSDFKKDTKLIKEKINSISENNRSSNQDHNVTRLSNYKSSHGNANIIDDEIVGFLDEEIKVVEHIVRGSEDMEVVLIAGMPGLGKTTLAKKVYNNQTVAEYFDLRSWCCVSQVYQRKDLIFQILKHIKPNEEDMDEDRLSEILRKELMQMRYLIVMDDIWDTTAWDDLRRCFPDARNGSRILLTSRFNDIPLQSKTKIHFLNPLSDNESWELLQKKLRLGENCNSELLQTGYKIAKGCKGVPLVVVLVAGLLADMNLDQWQKVACNVTSYVVNDSQRQCADILDMSYKNLPCYLKPCFLYFGCFPPDSEITSEKLTQLWIAEGFIKRGIIIDVEHIAEGYLMDLVQRNLIQVAERRSLGGIRTCRTHDLIHDFCSSKGKEEKFVQRITDPSDAVCKQTVRLSILYDWSHNSIDWSSYIDVCTLLFYSNIQTNSSSYIFGKFKLLRVLDLLTPLLMWDIIDLPDAIGLLVHLRFLAGPFSSIPSSVGNLTNLVTFHMVALGTDVINLPSTFFSLRRLRHLHINSATIFGAQNHDPITPFYSLQTLSTLLLPAYGDSSVLTLFPSLRKLKCLYVNRQPRITSPDFNPLSDLESLDITYLLGDWDETVPLRNINRSFNFPPSIRKLTLKMFCLPWSEMSIIEKLPNLEVLKLDRSSFVGKEWNMGDCVFHKLKYLRLRGLNIIRWNASKDHFSRLENLVVQGCEYLEEIPTDFGNIFTLRMIEVSGCKFSVEESAREIYEEQVEYGNEELKILARDNDANKAYIWSGTVTRRLSDELL